MNLSVHLLNDAGLDKYDCAIIVTNDSDMAEALKLVKQEFPDKQIGLIPPMQKSAKRPTQKLSGNADFTKDIKSKHLRKSQFPDPVLSFDGKRYYKPKGW